MADSKSITSSVSPSVSKSIFDAKTVNILMLGETQVGKTALIKRYAAPQPEAER